MDSQLITIFLGVLGILTLFLIWYTIRLNKRITSLLGNSKNQNLEGAIFDFYREVKDAKTLFSKNDDHVHRIIDESSRFFSRWSLIPYNAYGDMGGDMSFILCVLDKEGNGFLINSIHSRNGTRLYSKEIKNGKYKGTLSTEETDAIDKALNQSIQTKEDNH
jgi:hypothetical protein